MHDYLDCWNMIVTISNYDIYNAYFVCNAVLDVAPHAFTYQLSDFLVLVVDIGH